MSLHLDNLRVSFHSAGSLIPAVRGVSLEVERGTTLALVGESGCGKTTTANAMMGLLAETAQVLSGRLQLGSDEYYLASCRDYPWRGRRMGMVFQDAMTCLNPVLRIGTQLRETLQQHGVRGRRDADQRAEQLLVDVGMNEPARRLRQYPHQLSGGMRQRVAIAIALAPDPAVLIADEPTTALDVTVEAQILELLARLQRDRRMTVIIITHDLGVVARTADTVAVMYAGRIVELGAVRAVFEAPEHPYTQGLLSAVRRRGRRGNNRYAVIRGAPPSMDALPQGCPFCPRCDHVIDRCRLDEPPLRPGTRTALKACWVDGLVDG